MRPTPETYAWVAARLKRGRMLDTEAQAYMERLEQQRDAALEYADHKVNCEKVLRLTGEPCSCGLDALLSEIGK